MIGDQRKEHDPSGVDLGRDNGKWKTYFNRHQNTGFKKIIISYNSNWLAKMKFEEVNPSL